MKHGDGISLTTSPVPDAFPGRGRRMDVSERWGRQSFLETVNLGFGNVSKRF